MTMFRSLHITGHRFRFTIGEALLGIVILAVPLASWASELHRVRNQPPVAQSTVPSAAVLANTSIKYNNKLKAVNITYALCTVIALVAYVKFLVRRRAKVAKNRITGI
jgi:hypothetical protein